MWTLDLEVTPLLYEGDRQNPTLKKKNIWG